MFGLQGEVLCLGDFPHTCTRLEAGGIVDGESGLDSGEGAERLHGVAENMYLDKVLGREAIGMELGAYGVDEIVKTSEYDVPEK